MDRSLADTARQLTERYPNVRLVDLVESEPIGEHLSFDDYVLPPDRNMEKDTAEFILIQQRKLAFVQEAVRRETPTMLAGEETFFAWIDFGIFHLFRGDASREEAIREGLRRVATLSLPTDRIIAPGCWPIEAMANRDLWKSICWRFCGGFLIGHHRLWEAAWRRQQELVQRALPRLTWEVNIWTMMEEYFHIVPADHNARILFCLFQFFGKTRET